jgi:hypothetical protein
MPTRPLAVPLILLLVAVSSLDAMARLATPADVDVTIDDHLAWVLSLFEGGADDLDAADLESRFDASFLRLVPPEEFIATVRQLAGAHGPLALVEEQRAETGEYLGLYRGESGEGVLIAFAVDPETGLIIGFFITPAALPAGGATPVATPRVTPAASPAATPST